MKIAFGSCSKIQSQPVQPAWKSIEDENPDHLLLLGDNVYSPWWRWSHKKMEKRYRQQFSEPNFKSLIETVPYNAIWDDHDFGPNNKKGAHTSEKKKNKSRELFHKYMNCSTNRPNIYHSIVLGDIKIIMLDTRYYRQKPRYENATLLGHEQESWLVNVLNHDNKYTLVCSGSCLTSGGERLVKYKSYYPILMDLLRNKERLLFLSGDIHNNKFLDHDGFFEVISSGIGRGNKNNYGIIEFKDDAVNVNLYGSRKKSRNEIKIDVNSWEVLNQSSVNQDK